MTWHAARFLLIQALTLAGAALLVFIAWFSIHRGRHIALRWFRVPQRHAGWVRVAGGIIVVAAAMFLFVNTLRSVLTDGRVVESDRRLHNTLRLFRSERLHLSYSAVSTFAGLPFLVPFALALAMLFWVHGRRYETKLFIAAIAGAEVLAIGLKFIVRRPRPPDAIALASGPSFPSGHTLAAVAVYGILAFLLLRERPLRRWHLIAALALMAMIVLVPISRIYLGLQWPHDATASLDLGVAWLACLMMLVHFRPDGTRREDEPAPIRPAAFAALIGAAIVYGAVLASLDVQPEARPSLPPPASVAAGVLRQFPRTLHRTSEDLIGGAMEPLSFLFVGSASDLQSNFERAGWFLADPPSVHGLAEELWAVIRDRPDPHGPATPSYYAAQPQDFTFERPGTSSGSIRHRHHIRIWRAPICILPACTTIWAATCSYDAGVEFVPKPYLLTHRIDPHIDREREFVAATLRSAGARDFGFITVTGPAHGKNAGGDAFITDGRAHVIQVAP